MICPACGVQQPEGAECISCHTPVKLKAGESDISLEPAPSLADILSEGKPEAQAAEKPIDSVKQVLEEQEKRIEEQEKQIQAQLAKMEEEKQRLLEIRQNHEKQMQEMKALEEQKKAEQKASEIVQAVDKFKNILVSALPVAENRPVLEYKGLVGAQVLIKTDLLDSIMSGLKDACGLRNTAYYENLKKGFQIGLSDLKIEASKLQANAVLGVTLREEYMKDQVLVLSFTGMAVVLPDGKL